MNFREKKILNTHILLIGGKAMIDTRRQDDQIILLDAQADPLVILATDVKVPGAVEDIPNLLVLVQMLVEEGANLGLVRRTEGGR